MPAASVRGLLVAPLLTFLSAVSADAALVTIVNPGFETTVVANGSWSAGAPGWTTVGNPSTYNPPASAFPAQAPEGQNTLAIGNNSGGGTASQILTATLQAATQYTLTAMVGQRADYGLVGYQIQLLAGGVLLAEDNSTLSPAPGTFQQSTVSFLALDGNPQLGQNLEIRLLGPALGQVNFDSITLDATAIPEPASMGMLAIGIGVAGAGAIRRRRRPAAKPNLR